MKKCITLTLIAVAIVLNAAAHCQIPCGIYNDATRFTLMYEHIATIEKSMIKINQRPPTSSNQLIRWINNKDDHADQLTDIVTAYFLTQRIKPSEPAEKYVSELKLLHAIMIASMKAKQTTDLKYVSELNGLLHEFEHLYRGEAPAEHPQY